MATPDSQDRKGAPADSDASGDGASDLAADLFDGVTAEDAAPAQAKDTGQVATAFRSMLSRPWPSWVPGADQAIQILTDQQACPAALLQATTAFKEALTPLEKIALVGEAPPPELAPVRAAVLITWRLKMADAIKPAAHAQIDAAFCDGLLAEVDQVLGTLIVPEDFTNPEYRETVEKERAAIARLAVDMVNTLRKFSTAPAEASPGPPAAPRPPPAADRYKQTQARLVSIQTSQGGLSRTQKLAIGVGICAVIAVGFNGILFLTSRPPGGIGQEVTNFEGPAGFTAVKSGQGILELKPTGPSADPEKLKVMKAEANAKGKDLVVGPDGKGFVVDLNVVFHGAKDKK